MEHRPKIKLKKTNLDKFIEGLTWLILLAMWILVLLNFADLPNEIPIHFNAKGEADRFGVTATIFIIPVTASLIAWLIFYLSKVPHIHNYPRKITKENALKQYTLSVRMSRISNLTLAIAFSLIVFEVMQYAHYKQESFGLLLLPLLLVLVFAPLIYYTIKLITIKPK